MGGGGGCWNLSETFNITNLADKQNKLKVFPLTSNGKFKKADCSMPANAANKGEKKKERKDR